jgi:hypothetical protein
MINNPFPVNCDGSVMYYYASQTIGEDTIVRLCRRHAEAVGFGVDHFAGSAEPNALCDESTCGLCSKVVRNSASGNTLAMHAAFLTSC